MFHLPDLPNVGYATRAERAGSDAIMTFMRDVERDRLRLVSIVCDGREKWRTVARDMFGHSVAITDDVLDEIFWYFTLQCAKPRGQIALLRARNNPDITRKIVAVILPHLERERERLRLQRAWSA